MCYPLSRPYVLMFGISTVHQWKCRLADLCGDFNDISRQAAWTQSQTCWVTMVICQVLIKREFPFSFFIPMEI